MNKENLIFPQIEKDKKEKAIKSLDNLPKDFSLPKNPKAIVLDPSKEGDLELIF